MSKDSTAQGSFFSSVLNGHPHPDLNRIKQAEGLAKIERNKVAASGGNRNGQRPSPPHGKHRARPSSAFLRQKKWRDGQQRMWYGRFSKEPNKALDYPSTGSDPTNERDRDRAASEQTRKSEATKSIALACEMKFRETQTLARMDFGVDARVPPHPDIARVCCSVLEDLAQVCGPLRRLVLEIKEEVACALFADYAEPMPGERARCQMPFFQVCNEQREEIFYLREETQLAAQKNMELEKKLHEEKMETQKLTCKLATLESELGNKESELKDLSTNLGKVTEGFLRLKDEHEGLLKELREVNQAKTEKEAHANQQIYVYQMRLTQLQSELNKALNEVAFHAKHRPS